ncbi:MAG TPA: cytochrome P450 [Polyangiaceae bacterium]|nr:cytochrome P450 [Polyangiaceae bacterium]
MSARSNGHVAAGAPPAAGPPRLPPGPPPRRGGVLESVKYAANFLWDPFAFVGERFARYGDVYYAPSRGVGLYVIRRPEHVRELLVTQADAFAKGHSGLRGLSRALGEGLLTSDGEVWRRHRRLANPAFAKKAIGGYVGAMVREAVATREALGEGRVRDLAADMTALTLRVVGRTLFGTDVAADVDTIARSMRVFQTTLAAPAALPGPLQRLVGRRAARATADLDAIVARLFAARRGAPASPPDLAQMLLDAVDPDDAGARLTEREVRDELVTFLLAGHETTSNTLAWALYLLSRSPAAEARLCAEVDEVLAGRPPGPDELERLRYTEQVIKEALRLYPPAFAIPRSVARDVRLGGYDVPAGSEVIAWVYFTHRDPVAFPEPESFRPERFEPEAEARLPRGAYVPFGAGPRACIGRAFAMSEAVAALACLYQTHTFEYARPRPPRLVGRITLAPGGGLPMRPRRRRR